MIMWFIMAPGFVLTAGLLWLLVSGGELQDMLVMAIGLCAVLFVALLYRPTRWYAAAATLVVPAALAFMLRPTCIPMKAEELEMMSPPIEQRLDTDLYMPIFQKQDDGSWQQCKTQLSRWMFR